MNRYALEMHAHEKHQRLVADASSRDATLLTTFPFSRLPFRSVTRVSDDLSEQSADDSMTFLYELRCDLVAIDLDEALPLLK